MSAGVPARPSGIIGAITSMPGKSPASVAWRAIGVSTTLGAIVFGGDAAAGQLHGSAWVSEITPPFDAE